MRSSTRHSIALCPAMVAAAVALSWAPVARAIPGAGQRQAELDPTRADGLPPELEGVGINPALGAQLPLDVELVNQDGHAVRLGDYANGDKPVVLVFAYYACPMLCTLVLNGAMEAMQALPWATGGEYRVVTVSFDPRDTVELAGIKRAAYLKALGRPIEEKGWDFLTGSEANVKRLAQAAGFSYRWIEEQNEFAHAAGLFVLTPDGKVSRVLYGLKFETADVRLALTEASGGRIASLTERLLLFCFHYEPKQGKYVLAAQRLMKAAGVMTMAALGLTVASLRRGERLRATTAGEARTADQV